MITCSRSQAEAPVKFKDLCLPQWVVHTGKSVPACTRSSYWDCTGGRGQHADRHFPLLSGPISVWQVNGEHKTYLKATFTTWLIPLHCVISRCHISPQRVCLNALTSTLWLVSLGWLPKIHPTRAPYPFTSSLRGKTLYCTFYLDFLPDEKKYYWTKAKVVQASSREHVFHFYTKGTN